MGHRTFTICLLLALLGYLSGGTLFAHQQLDHASTTDHHDHKPDAPQPDPSDDPCEVCDALAGLVATLNAATDTAVYEIPPSAVPAPVVMDAVSIQTLFNHGSRAPPTAHL